MSTDTAESVASAPQPTAQTGVTSSPISSDAQDFSGSDDGDIDDSFVDGPTPGSDDHIPMGLGGEKGRQSEPASSTLEADIINGTTKQPGVNLPPDNPAGESEPVQDPAGDGSEEGTETSPEPIPKEEGPETPEFPPALLQMAGYADVAAAQAAGFQNPESLFAVVRWRSQQMTPGAQSSQSAPSSEQGLYRRPAQQPAASAAPVQLAPEVVAKPEETGGLKPFRLPDDKRAMLDEDMATVLDEVIDGMNQHHQQESQRHQQELESLRSSVGKRESDLVRQREWEEEALFDKAVQNLGDEWQETFGEGSGTELDRKGQSDPVAMTNFNHRALLFETVEAMREVSAKQGFSPLDLNTEVQYALMQRYPDKFQQIISGSSNGSASGASGSGQRKGVTASRPTQRKTPPKGRSAKLVSDVNAMLAKQGKAPLDRSQEDEFEGDI